MKYTIEPNNKGNLNVFFIYSEEKNERFIGNLINNRKFCISCGNSCDDCRLEYESHTQNIVGVHFLEDNLPDIIEEPEKYFPDEITDVDVLVGLKIHPDLLIYLPYYCEKNKIKALIIPCEDKNWISIGVQNQMEYDLKKFGIQYAFPRPFCALKSNGQPIIEKFIRFFRIGFPSIKINIQDDKIIDCKVEISSPCGCMWYITRELKRNQPIIDLKLKEIISKAHHSYPCNASMIEDNVLKDTTLHIAGYIHRASVYKAIISVSNKFPFIEEELNQMKDKLNLINKSN